MVETRIFCATGLDQKDLARMVSSWLKIHDFDSQLIDLPEGKIAVQARQPESWRSILGMSSALNITFMTKGSDLVVETEAGRWADKIAVGAVGAFIIHPLLITVAYGAWKQSQLPDRVFEVIEQYLKEHKGSRVVSDTASAAAPEGTTCPNCGQTVKIGAKYCDQCGTRLKPAPVKID